MLPAYALLIRRSLGQHSRIFNGPPCSRPSVLFSMRQRGIDLTRVYTAFPSLLRKGCLPKNTVAHIMWSMKNITLSVDDDVLTKVRRYAAEHDATVNGLVRDYLTRLARHDDRAATARRRIRELSEQSEARIGGKTWDRVSLHER